MNKVRLSEVQSIKTSDKTTTRRSFNKALNQWQTTQNTTYLIDFAGKFGNIHCPMESEGKRDELYAYFSQNLNMGAPRVVR